MMWINYGNNGFLYPKDNSPENNTDRKERNLKDRALSICTSLLKPNNII